MIQILEDDKEDKIIAIPIYPDSETPTPFSFTFWGGLNIGLTPDLDKEQIDIDLNHKIFKGTVKIDLYNLIMMELGELTENEDDVSEYEESIKPNLLLFRDTIKNCLKAINMKLDEVDSFINDNT